MSAKKTFNFDFVEAEYFQPFMLWIDHKRQCKQGYKTQGSIELCYKRLKEISNNNPITALAIIEQSIANNWQGLFPLKNNKYESVANRQSNGLSSAIQSLKDDMYTLAAGGGFANPT